MASTASGGWQAPNSTAGLDIVVICSNIQHIHNITFREATWPLSKKAIFDAADALDAGGQRPTLAALRKAVGGGSFTTISEAMKEWWAGRALREAPAREPAPAVVGERLGEVAGEIWALALQVANERLAGEREAFDAARVQAEQEKVEAVELADAVSAELELLQGKFSALEEAERTARQEAASAARATGGQPRAGGDG